MKKIEDEMTAILSRLTQNGVIIRQAAEAQKENEALRKRLRELTCIYSARPEAVVISVVKEQV